MLDHAMNWEAISAIGQFVGALAVVISLIYLANEVRSSARATRLAGMRSTLDAFNWLPRGILWPDRALRLTEPNLAELYTRGLDDFESFEGADRVRFRVLMHTIFRNVEDVYCQHLQGNLDPRVWRAYEGSSTTLIHIPEFRPGGVHTRIGSMRSLRSSSISNSNRCSPPLTGASNFYMTGSKLNFVAKLAVVSGD